MFGSGSSNPWGATQQPNQQQQQQQQPGASGFGSAGFGTGGTSGTAAFGGSTFGQQQQQPQQPQQPQAVNPMFGGTPTTAAPATTTGTSGFGAFGGTGAFGQKPAAGFGTFGGSTGTSGFGASTSTFGQPSQPAGQTSAFGQPSTTSTFGSGLFGQKPTTTTGAFGSTSTTTDVATQPITTGTLNPPYQVFTEKEVNGTQTVTLHYQSISAMPAYRNMSFEELRVQDYAQGRKTAGAFGQSAFGLGQQTQQTSAFGQPSTGTSAFGAFGQPSQQQQTQAQPTSFGSFGQTPTSQPSAFGGGTGASTFGTTFGQQQQQQQPPPQQQTGVFGSGTSAFGQPSTQQQQQQPSTFGGTGAFGQTQQPKPFGSFGTGTSAFGGGGTFGQGTQTGQTSMFGQPASSQPPQGTGSAFGTFGSGTSALSKPSIFGQPASQPQTTGFGAFGQGTQAQQPQQQQQPGQQPQQQPQTTSMFGQPSTGTGMFGQPQTQTTQIQTQPPQTSVFGQQQTQPSTGGIFGSNGTTGSMFGQPANKPAFGGGIFGQPAAQTTPTTTAQPQTSNIFGGQFGQQTAQQPTGMGTFGGGTSMFGQKPSAGIFGQTATQPSTTGLGQSLLGASALGAMGVAAPAAGALGTQQPAALTASVEEPVSKNLPIFSLLQPNNLYCSVIEQSQKKVPSYFVDIPHRSTYSMSASRMSASGKLRGFGSSHAAGLNRLNGLQSSLAASTAPFSASIGPKGDQKVVSLLGPEAFLNGGLGERKLGTDSPRKLVLDRPLDSRMLGASGKATDHRVDFVPTLSITTRMKELSSSTAPKAAIPAPTTTKGQEKKSVSEEKKPEELKFGDYWVEPSLEKLRSMSNGELSSFSGLKVGRKGYGEVHFLEEVDLTALPRLSTLLGRIVQIENKEVCVYPESEDGFDDSKPQPGEGINVRARVILLGCWPVDKATREPIKDEKHPSFIKHLKRLKSMKYTHFEEYDVKDGKWTFTVEHF